jgi:hypothetical protein
MLEVIIPLYATGFICAGAGPAASAWYLSPSGSDSAGVGSREKPWRTIRFATGNMPEDDILGHPRGARPDIGCFEHGR